ncbi:MAG: adenylosuccinate synthase [Fimbriimonadaceae bacterium]|nr:adenylosuccinate synthase [Fimbriimonadaceae bacterium]
MDESVRHTCVVGLQFGDEGKGQLVDHLAATANVVVRFNGGANAGHTVRLGESRFALHLLPSGVITPGTTNVVAHGVALDPQQLLAEIDQLAERGISLTGRLLVSDRAHLVMPWQKAEERLLEAAAGRLGLPVIGSTGRGIGPTYAAKAHRLTAIRAGELRRLDRLAPKIAAIVTLQNALLTTLAALSGSAFEPFEVAAVLAALEPCAARLAPYLADTASWLDTALADGQTVLFEGAHSALLDVDLGTYPYVTSSACTPLGLGVGSGLRDARVDRVIGVLKAYGSRVGAGPFPSQADDLAAARLRERGQEFGTSTGRPRRCGWLDLVLAGYTARRCGVTGLAVTGLDVLSDLAEIPLVVAYDLDGQRLTTPPAEAVDLAACQPVCEMQPGWRSSLADCRDWADLPAAARAYVARLAATCGPVAYVCVGPRREQVLPLPATEEIAPRR